MNCRHLKTSSLSLFFRVSKRPSRFRSESIGSHCWGILIRPPRNLLSVCLLRTLAIGGVKESMEDASASRSAETRYPKVHSWIDPSRSRCDKDPVRKKNGFRPSLLSSWEDSAENYFSRDGGRKLKDDVEGGNGGRNLKISDSEEGVSAEVEKEKPADQRSWLETQNWSKRRSREAAEFSMPKMIGQCVYGVGPVLAALTAARREFFALYVQQGLNFNGSNSKKKKKKNNKNGVEKILKLADKILGLKIIEVSKHDLNMASDNRPHQGIVLDASPLEIVDVKELEPPLERDQRSPLWVALDEVTDPQNLGAIIRSAYFFGAEGVVICAKNSAPLSGVVCKASAGSLELIELRSCKNMMKFLTASTDNGWRVLGGSASPKALSLHEVKARIPTILVLGSEGSGLRPLVERSCAQLIRIPGSMAMDSHHIGDTEGEGNMINFFLAVESLNVSVAAGVLLYHLVGDAKHFAVENTSNSPVDIVSCQQ